MQASIKNTDVDINIVKWYVQNIKVSELRE